MKFFPVVCGRPTRRLWSQHAVIMLREGRSGGPRIIFPTKSICGAAGVEHLSHFVIVEPLFADFGHRYLKDAADAAM